MRLDVVNGCKAIWMGLLLTFPTYPITNRAVAESLSNTDSHLLAVGEPSSETRPLSDSGPFSDGVKRHRAPFSQGSWTFQSYGSAAVGDENGEVYSAHIGVGYYGLDNFSINLEAVGGYIAAQEGEESEVKFGGFDLLFRLHFLQGHGWTVYFDGGAGLQQSTDPFPNGGTHFNFRPQAGLGFTWQIAEPVFLMAGARWFHVSNANREGEDNNPGYDSGQFYAGLMIPF